MTGRPAASKPFTEYNQAYYEKKKAQVRARVRALQRRRRDAVNEIKLKLGCQRCGYNKCARALQFHHPNDDKEHDVARMVAKGKNMELIKAEIKKCVCVCANCHMEIHDEENGR